jgi:hypothetical protein
MNSISARISLDDFICCNNVLVIVKLIVEIYAYVKFAFLTDLFCQSSYAI